MEMVEQIMLLELESEIDGWGSDSFCHFSQPEPPLEMNGI